MQYKDKIIHNYTIFLIFFSQALRPTFEYKLKMHGN